MEFPLINQNWLVFPRRNSLQPFGRSSTPTSPLCVPGGVPAEVENLMRIRFLNGSLTLLFGLLGRSVDKTNDASIRKSSFKQIWAASCLHPCTNAYETVAIQRSSWRLGELCVETSMRQLVVPSSKQLYSTCCVAFLAWTCECQNPGYGHPVFVASSVLEV